MVLLGYPYMVHLGYPSIMLLGVPVQHVPVLHHPAPHVDGDTPHDGFDGAKVDWWDGYMASSEGHVRVRVRHQIRVRYGIRYGYGYGIRYGTGTDTGMGS